MPRCPGFGLHAVPLAGNGLERVRGRSRRRCALRATLGDGVPALPDELARRVALGTRLAERDVGIAPERETRSRPSRRYFNRHSREPDGAISR